MVCSWSFSQNSALLETPVVVGLAVVGAAVVEGVVVGAAVFVVFVVDLQSRT